MFFAFFLAAVSCELLLQDRQNSAQRHVLDDTRTVIPANDHINVGTYAGATAGVVLGFFIILVCIYCFCCRKREGNLHGQQLLKGEPLQEDV